MSYPVNNNTNSKNTPSVHASSNSPIQPTPPSSQHQTLDPDLQQEIGKTDAQINGQRESFEVNLTHRESIESMSDSSESHDVRQTYRDLEGKVQEIVETIGEYTIVRELDEEEDNARHLTPEELGTGDLLDDENETVRNAPKTHTPIVLVEDDEDLDTNYYTSGSIDDREDDDMDIDSRALEIGLEELPSLQDIDKLSNKLNVLLEKCKTSDKQLDDLWTTPQPPNYHPMFQHEHIPHVDVGQVGSIREVVQALKGQASKYKQKLEDYQTFLNGQGTPVAADKLAELNKKIDKINKVLDHAEKSGKDMTSTQLLVYLGRLLEMIAKLLRELSDNIHMLSQRR